MLSNQTRPEYFPQAGFPSACLASFPFPSVCTSVCSWRDWDPEGGRDLPKVTQGNQGSHRSTHITLAWRQSVWQRVASAVKDLEVRRLSWIEPNVMTRVLVKEIQECQHQRRGCKDRNRGCSDVATSHRMQAAGKGKGAEFPQPFRRHASLPTPSFQPSETRFRLLSPQNCKMINLW